jgi:pyruvate,water dikinase
LLKENQEVTVDGHTGKVYNGKVKIEIKHEETKLHEEKTATKIYMNLGIPEKIDEYKDLPFDGIGLMRIEFIIATDIKKHPLYLIEIGEEQFYIDKLAEGIEKVAKAIYPKPIIVRFSDFKTNEYKDLEGGEKFEPHEDNPLIGWRGVSRYVSPEFESAFRLECRAIKKVRENYKNVHSMLPFVRITSEVEKCLEIMKSEGLERSNDFKIALMAEVPSIIFLADQFCKYADIFSIGSNDLTMLILGIDRDSERLGKMGYFDERNLAVERAIKHLIIVAHKNNVKVSICGQAPSEYPEIVEFLIRNGIDSISVNPDVVSAVRTQVAITERKILLEQKNEKSDLEF